MVESFWLHSPFTGSHILVATCISAFYFLKGVDHLLCAAITSFTFFCHLAFISFITLYFHDFGGRSEDKYLLDFQQTSSCIAVGILQLKCLEISAPCPMQNYFCGSPTCVMPVFIRKQSLMVRALGDVKDM